jgi:hypothetical protein
VTAARRDEAGLRLTVLLAVRQAGEGTGSRLPARELISVGAAVTWEFFRLRRPL